MQITIMSSWGEKCGISEYSHELVTGMRGHFSKDDNVKIVANIATASNPLADESDVYRLFHCPFMTHQHTADVESIIKLAYESDVLHIQFETSLYHPSWFIPMIYELKKLGVKVVLTMHSSGMWPEFDCRDIDAFISHEPFPWCKNNVVIPMGIKQYDNTEWAITRDPPTIMSFGLGRNMDEFVLQSIDGLGVMFKTTYGNSNWLSRGELIDLLKHKADIITLIYPPTGANVSSSAATFALGLAKPLIVSNTNWFRHVQGIPAVYVCDSGASFRACVKTLIDPSNTSLISDHIRNRGNEIKYLGKDFNNFLLSHLNLYQSLSN